MKIRASQFAALQEAADADLQEQLMQRARKDYAVELRTRDWTEEGSLRAWTAATVELGTRRGVESLAGLHRLMGITLRHGFPPFEEPALEDSQDLWSDDSVSGESAVRILHARLFGLI